MKIRAILNPKSGMRKYQKTAREVIETLVASGSVSYCEYVTTNQDSGAYDAAFSAEPTKFDILLVVGGDGTINQAVNGVIDSGSDMPLAVLPGGTANDFCNFIGIPKTKIELADMICRKNVKRVDVGLTGGKHFVNVVAGGAFTDVSYLVSPALKQRLGMKSYYASCVNSARRHLFHDNYIEFSWDNGSIVENCALFMVANTSRVGGFRNITPRASIHDGLLDVLIIRKRNIISSASVFLSVLSGNGSHTNNPDCIYFQTSKLTINQSGALRHKPLSVGVDGERFGRLPLTIEAVPSKINIIYPWQPLNTSE